MKHLVTRRDFLKLSGLLPLSLATPHFVSSLDAQKNQQNVLIIVFDALSAKNISLYGYQRETMPNLARLANRSVVYHNHYAGGNYTTPGTNTLLTGTLSWTHRAHQHGSPADKSFVHKNIFSAFQNHYRIAYSHNVWVYTIFNLFKQSFDKYIPLEEYLLESDKFIPKLFRYDSDIATLSWSRTINNNDDGHAYSLFLSNLYEKFRLRYQKNWANIRSQYPRGITKNGHYPFLLEQAVDEVGNLLAQVRQPFLGYFHFYPPHEPYNTHRDFFGRFENDGYKSVSKPVFQKIDNVYRYEYNPDMINARIAYDELILHVDREFGKLYNNLQASGLLENTWVILTSDHGEMFERGIVGHRTSTLYDPVVRIPLLIFEPGRQTRKDVYEPTNAVDVLPTLLHVTGQQSADWAEGVVLPPFSNTNLESDRSIYSVEAKRNKKYAPFTVMTTTLRKGTYKLMYFAGYEGLGLESERIELYDLDKDPEELNDLSQTKRETSSELLHEIKNKLAEVNEPYQ